MIRDNIVPSLNGFDINLIPRMMEFCKHSSDAQVEYDILLDSIPINKIDNTYIIEIVKWTSLYLSINYWQGIINRITRMENIKTIKTKSIQSMINQIEQKKVDIKISLSIKLTVIININKIIFIII